MKKILKSETTNKCYEMDQYIGTGSNGKVYSSPPFAIKQVTPSANSSQRSQLQNQARILMELDHPNIVKIRDYIIQNQCLYLVMDLCDMDLTSYRNQYTITEGQAFKIMRDIVEGLMYLVGKNIIHRDLKSSNILYSKKQNKFKIADFGLAKYIGNFQDDLMQSYAGTPLYMSPQLLNNEQYTSKSDIWSVGIIFYELLFRKFPWPNNNSIKQLYQDIKKSPKPFPIYLSNQARYILERCLTIQQKLRMTWDQLFQKILGKCHSGHSRMKSKNQSQRNRSIQQRSRATSNENKSRNSSNQKIIKPPRQIYCIICSYQNLTNILFVDLQDVMVKQQAQKIAYKKFYIPNSDQIAQLREIMSGYVPDMQQWLLNERSYLRF